MELVKIQPKFYCNEILKDKVNNVNKLAVPRFYFCGEVKTIAAIDLIEPKFYFI